MTAALGPRWSRRAALLLATLTTFFTACSRDEEGALGGVGTIELTSVDVAPVTSARVTRVWAEEGQSVRRGDTLVSLVQTSLSADLDARRAMVARSEAELRDLAAGARPAQVEQAEAQLRAAEAEAERTAREEARNAPLLKQGAISESQFDQISSAARAAAARRDAARDALRLLRQGERANRLSAARAEVANARAALAMGEAVAGDLVLTAPIDGTVLGRYVEPGEVLAAGETAMSLGDAARPWVRVYVPAPELPRVRVGQAAQATIDGLPGRAFRGTVTAIATQAEFTPRIALTEKERADLLFGVKVELSDSTGVLKPGLPATVVIEAPAAPSSARRP